MSVCPEFFDSFKYSEHFEYSEYFKHFKRVEHVESVRLLYEYVIKIEIEFNALQCVGCLMFGVFGIGGNAQGVI